jgi:hypothetical protein
MVNVYGISVLSVSEAVIDKAAAAQFVDLVGKILVTEIRD